MCFLYKGLLIRVPKKLNICYKSIIIIKNKKMTETKLQALIMKFNELINSYIKLYS